MNHTEISDLELLEVIHESAKTLVQRARRRGSGDTVILKRPKPQPGGRPAAADMAGFRREYELIRGLAFADAIRVHGFIPMGASCAIVLEDLDARSLRQHLAEIRPMPVAQAVALAIRVITHLGRIHQSGVVHKDINPSNIIWNPTTNVLKIIDYGISSGFHRQSTSFAAPTAMEGTLAYIAPEQTGRMNRAVDRRADYYSLGATLYELLTGSVPFTATDPLELVHCHLAQLPEPPHRRNPAVPEMLSRIVMKLLAKGAEERYQSPTGIIADLERCSAELQVSGAISEFALGTRDLGEHLQISEQLYGREHEIEALMQAFARIRAGGRELVLVSGRSGAGKTKVVQELFRPITRARGFFLAGKHDQLERDVPYSAIARALQGLVRQLLGQDEAGLANWRERLAAAVQQNGQLILDIVPELEAIIGPQPPVPEASAVQAQARFAQVWQRFLRALCAAEHPLVLFLDDLQWADPSSLKLIEIAMSDDELGHFLLIGAYRDNEVDALHPTTRTWRTLEAQAVPIHRLVIGPLGPSMVTRLLSDTLRAPAERVQPLAALVIDKTGGIPLFVNRYLQALHRKELLVPNSSTGAWQWDEQAIRDQAVSDDLATLLVAHIQELPPATQRALRTAALLGNRIHLGLLAVVLESSASEVFAALAPALTAAVLEPLSSAVSSTPGDLDAPLVIETMRFVHDRLQEACRALVPDSELAAEHVRIGRLMRAQLPPQPSAHELFEVIRHLDQARALLTEDERNALTELELDAGERAWAALAADVAESYFARVRAVLMAEAAPAPAPITWNSRPDLAYRAMLGSAQVALARGHLDQAAAHLAPILEHVSNPIQRAAAYVLLIHVATFQARLQDAWKLTVEALQPFDIDLPTTDDAAVVAGLTAQVEAKIAGRSMAELIALPAATAPETAAKLALLDAFCPASFYLGNDISFATALLMIRVMLDEGAHGLATWGFTTFSSQLRNMGHMDRSVETGEAAIALAERFGATAQLATACLTHATLILPWNVHVSESRPLFLRGVEAAQTAGTPAVVAYNLSNLMLNDFVAGMALSELAEQCQPLSKHLERHPDIATRNFVHGFARLIGLCTGQVPAAFASSAQSDGPTEAELLARWHSEHSFYALATYQVYRAFVHLLFGEPALALEHLRRAAPLMPFTGRNLAMPLHGALTGLALAQILAEQPGTEEIQAEARAELDTWHQQLTAWAARCPANFAAFEAALAAEHADLGGNWGAALNHWREATALARSSGFPHFEALFEERLANRWRARGMPEYAEPHLVRAYDAYRRWGATRKLDALERSYPELAASARAPALATAASIRETTSSHSTESLDLASVLKAAQALSREIVLETLLGSLMRVLFENAGADRGTLLLMRDSELVVQAEGRADALDALATSQGTPLADWSGGAQSVVNYVRRTGESVVLGRIGPDMAVAQDPYLVAHEVRSLLCMPIISHGNIIGVLYLENRLAHDVFTADRVQVLELLAGQMAISLENARLYQDLATALEEARESSRVKSEFLAVTSHELRTPLNAILNIPRGLLKHVETVPVARCPACAASFELEPEAAAEVAADMPCPECGATGLERAQEWAWMLDTGDVVMLLRRLVDSGEHLLAMVENILEFSQLESSHPSPNVQQVDTIEVCTRVLELMRPMADKKHIELALVYPDGERARWLRADPVELRQILTNLIDNAIKFSPADSRVEVSARVIDPVDINGEPLWEMAVRDQGIGIPADSHDMIFESFRQLGRGTTRSHGGVGLGLAIAKKLCALHGGTIHVDSAPGQGSTFVVRLPLGGPR